LHVAGGAKPQVRFSVKNTGTRPGAEVAELYAMLPAAAKEPPKRLVGYEKLILAPGESREVTVDVDPLFLTVYDEQENRMRVVPGRYSFAVGGSSQSVSLKQEVELPGQ
jgi:beta-glucosidase